MEFTEAYDNTSSTVGLCCRSGNATVLKKLLEEGRPVDVQDNRGWRPIHEAVNANSVSCLRMLINHERNDLNWKTFEGETPLLLAARKGLHQMVHTLLQSGADVNSVSNENETPLIAAAGFGSLPCVRMFLQEGAKLTDVDYSSWSALHTAADKNCMEVTACLLKHGASVSLQEDVGMTPVFLAAKNGFLDCLNLMLKHGKERGNAAVNVATFHGTTPLMIAAQNGHLDCVKLLVAYGADADFLSMDGLMALHLAISKGHIECVKYLLSVTGTQILLKKRRDILLNMSDDSPLSPLHLAVVWKRYDILLLLAESLNVDDFLQPTCADDTSHIVPSIHAVPHYETTFWPCAITCLGEAAQLGDELSVSLLLKTGCRPDAPTEQGLVNPLTVATLLGYEEVMELLLEAGADPNHRAPSVGSEFWPDMFPLLAARISRKRSVLEILLKAGADVRRIIPRHNTAGSLVWRYFNQGDIDQDNLDILSRMAEFMIEPHGSLMKLLSAYPRSARMSKREIFDPHPLSHLCRVTIRHAIIDGDSATNYRKKIKHFQLPSIVEQVLTFERDCEMFRADTILISKSLLQ